MAKETVPQLEPEIDERWIGEWVSFGLVEMESFLLHHLAFERYYERRCNGEA